MSTAKYPEKTSSPFRVLRSPGFLVAAGVSLWLGLAVLFAVNTSATTDEIPYLGAGLSYLDHFDYRMNPEQPPLVKYLCALPVYLFDRPDMSNRVRGSMPIARKDNPWINGTQGAYQTYLLFMADYKPVMPRLFLGRLPMIAVALLGGVVVLLLGRAIGGTRRAGLLAALFLLFYPEYLGHGSMMLLDVPMAIACGAQALAAWRWWGHSSKGNAALFIFFAAVGSLVKLPSVVFTIFVLFALAALSFFSAGRIRFRRVAVLTFLTLAGGIFAAWMGAGFRFSYVPAGADIIGRNPRIPPIETSAPSLLVQTVNTLWKWHGLPETTLTTLANYNKFKDRPYEFMGAVSTRGWYSYFFVTFLLKTTPALLVGLVALLLWGGMRFRERRRSIAFAWRAQREVILVAPFLLLFAVTDAVRVDQGHRYILFVYIPLCAYLGAAADRWMSDGRVWRLLAAVLVAGQLVSVLLAYPHFSTYFNFLVGDPYHGVRYVDDSNTDIGQDTLLLSQTIARLNLGTVNLALFGLNWPDAYGLTNYRWLSAITPPPYLAKRKIVDRPDPRLPTALSVNDLRTVRRAYPGLYDRDPDIYLNGIVIYLPKK